MKNDWQRFLVDRVVRIFVVLWPAVIISAIVCFALVHFLPDAPFVAHGGWSYSLSAPLTGDQSLAKWVSVTTLLNEIVMPTITTNGPLWSLAYEWSYYVVALAAVLIYRTYFSVGSVVIILYGLALFLAAAHNQPDVLFAGISWVAGAFARAAYNRDMLRGRATQIIGIALVVAVLIRDHRHPLPDPVLGLALAVMLAHSSWKYWTFGAHISERLASFSYSLYLIHFPALLAVLGVLYALGRVTHPLKFGGEAVIIIGAATLFVVLVARVFAWFTEDQTVVIRRSILNLIGTSHSKLRAPVTAAREITAKD